MSNASLQSCVCRVRLTVAMVIAIAFCSRDTFAQEASFFAASASNGKILAVTFDPPSTRVVNTDADRRTSLRSLCIRDDGVDGIHLIACDTLGGEVLFYEDAMGDGQVISSAGWAHHPRLPAGASLDFAGNVFLVSSGSGEEEDQAGQVWVILRDPTCSTGCLPGRYVEPLGLLDEFDGDQDNHNDDEHVDGDDDDDVSRFEQTLVVRTTAGILNAGDLLVLAGKPAMLLRYQAAAVRAFLDALRAGGPPPDEITPDVIIHPWQAVVPEDERFPKDARPRGMAFAPDGNLLITSKGGEVLIYQPSGKRRSDGDRFVDFASGLGKGLFKIAVGPQDGALRAYVSDRHGNEILRFRITDDGRGELQDAVGNAIDHPVGIANTTSNNEATPTGDGVTVAPSNVMQSTFEKVLADGVTNASVLVFGDPRESEVTVPADQPLHRPLFLNEVDAGLPAIEIPPHVRAFRRGDPVNGIPTFILVVAETTAQFAGIIDHHLDESVILGYQADCLDGDASAQPRGFWSPDGNDPPILEGAVFIDISTGCGSFRGISRDFSFFLGARDTRSVHEIAQAKLDSLAALVTSSSCLEDALHDELTRMVQGAMRALEGGRLVTAIRLMEQFLALVEASEGAFVDCSPHLSAELRARSISASFMLGKAGAEETVHPPDRSRSSK